MEIRLQKLSEHDLMDFLSLAKEDYAQGMVDNQGLDKTSAREKAERQTREFLNTELNVNKNYLSGIIDNSTKETVGGLMYQINIKNNTAFGCNILIFEQYRRKGYASATLQKLELELKEKGVKRFEFNVFEKSKGAFKLYQKLGYHITNFYMAKDL